MAIEIAQKEKKATVTFTSQARGDASHATLSGEWDNWTAWTMKKNTDGTFSVKITINSGKSYQFGYSIDGNWTPDTDLPLVASPFGTNNSILDLTEAVSVKKSAPKKKTAVKRKIGKKPAKDKKD